MTAANALDVLSSQSKGRTIDKVHHHVASPSPHQSQNRQNWKILVSVCQIFKVINHLSYVSLPSF